MTNQRPYRHPQFNLRIPRELKDKIEQLASEGGRSMNSEIIHRLEQSLSGADLLHEINQKLDLLLAKESEE